VDRLADLNPKRAILLMPFGLGDAVIATPALRALRRQFPQAHLCALAQPGVTEVIDGSNLVDETVVVRYPWHPVRLDPMIAVRFLIEVLRLRPRGWDLGIAFKGDARENATLFLLGAERRVNLGRWPPGRFTPETPVQRAVRAASSS